jgi:hypothetical protein
LSRITSYHGTYCSSSLDADDSGSITIFLFYNLFQCYLQLEQLLYRIVRKEGKWAHIGNELVHAIQAGIDKFNKYNEYMKKNMIYFISLILDPRVKTRWIKKNIVGVEDLIHNIKTFLKATYPYEAPESQPRDLLSQHHSLKWELLEEYSSTIKEMSVNDIDKYIDSNPIMFALDKKID